jgi:hypothetical protein
VTASTIFVRKVTSKRASSDRHKTRDVEQKRHVTSKQREARFSLNCEGNTLGQTGTAEELPSANVTRSNLVIQSGQWNRRRGLYLPFLTLWWTFRTAFPLEESSSIRAFRKSCASANAGEAPVMGSPPFLTTLLQDYCTQLGFVKSQFRAYLCWKQNFLVMVSSMCHFFTHGTYIDVKSCVESISGT